MVRKFYVGGIPEGVDTRQLREQFSVYGEMTDCVVMGQRGFLFVEYKEESAGEALVGDKDAHFIRGKKVIIKPADGKGRKGGGFKAGGKGEGSHDREHDQKGRMHTDGYGGQNGWHWGYWWKNGKDWKHGTQEGGRNKGGRNYGGGDEGPY